MDIVQVTYLLSINETMSHSQGRGLDTIGHAQLGQNIADVD